MIVGDATETEVRHLAERYFGDWSGPRPGEHLPNAAPNRPGRVVIADRPGSPQTQLLMGQIGVARTHPGSAALEVMSASLGGMFSSRINTNLRGYTYGSRSRFLRRRTPGPFSITAVVRTDATAAAVAEVFSEIDRVRDPLQVPLDSNGQ